MSGRHRWPSLTSSTVGAMLGGGRRQELERHLWSQWRSLVWLSEEPPPQTSSPLPENRRLPCPAHQCPFWSLALTDCTPSPLWQPPPSQAGVGVVFLHYCSSPSFNPLLIKVKPSPLVGLPVSCPSALLEFWLLCVTEACCRSGLSPKPVPLSVLDPYSLINPARGGERSLHRASRRAVGQLSHPRSTYFLIILPIAESS